MFSLSCFFLHRSWGTVKTPMLSSSHGLWFSTDLIGFASGWIERRGETLFPPLWAWICHTLGMVGIKRIGLVETIYCLKSLYFIIIIMKSLCCLPKCEENSQVSLLFIVYILFKVYSLGFSFKYSKNPQYNSSWGK